MEVKITKGKNYFFEFDTKWFEEYFHQLESDKYNYPSDIYKEKVNEIADMMYIKNKAESVRVNIQYGGNIQSVIDGFKRKTRDILLYDLDNNAWKHRYVMMIRPLTDKGVDILKDTFVNHIRWLTALEEISENIQLVGEIDEDVEQCSTCTLGK